MAGRLEGMTDTTVRAARRWAISSLAAGAIWLVLAVAPTFLTTLAGLPFAAYAFGAGWASSRRCRRLGDQTGARLAGWGIGLGCAGFVWVTAFSLVTGGLLIAALLALFKTISTGNPTL
jgi:apolipoprotein N-acyltransferase